MQQDMAMHMMEADRAPLVHIGYPKAMSWWLQHYLFKAHNGLPTIMGPMEAMRALIDHPPFEFDPKAVQNHLHMRREKQGAIGDAVPVITAENLSGKMFCGGYNAKMLADRLHQCFPAARVLLVIREQRRMMRSLYGEMIRTAGMPLSLDEVLNPIIDRTVPKFSFAYLRYDALVDYYRTLFGPERVLVLPAEIFVADGVEFLDRIRRFVELPPERLDVHELADKPPLNTGNKLTTLALARRFNRYFVRTGFNYRGLIRDRTGPLKFRHMRVDQVDRWIPKTGNEWLEKRFARKVEAAMEDAFTESNRRLARMTGLDLENWGYQV